MAGWRAKRESAPPVKQYGYASNDLSPRLPSMLRFDRLEVGRESYELTLRVYQLTEAFPKREWYGVGAQARRAALSVPLNIAEGAARRGRREFRRFLDIAFSSLAELIIVLRVCRDLKMLSLKEWEDVTGQANRTGKRLWALMRKTTD